MVPQYQSAFHKFDSCETALTKLVNDCQLAMEDKEVTALVAMDLSAAFDTVDHGILLDVLNKQFGVNGTALKWFNSYVHPRDCKVNVNGKTDFLVGGLSRMVCKCKSDTITVTGDIIQRSRFIKYL